MTKKQISLVVIGLAVSLLSLGFSVARAEDHDGSFNRESNSKPKPPIFRQINASTTDARKALQKDFRQEVRDIRSSSTTASTTKGMLIRDAAQERNAEWREIMENRKEKMEELRGERKTSLENLREIKKGEKRKEGEQFKLDKVASTTENIIIRLNQNIVVAEKRLANLKSLMDTLTKGGKDVSSVQDDVDAASLAIQDAKDSVNHLKDVIEKVKVSATPKDGVPLIKEAAKSAKEDLKTANGSLSSAYKALIDIRSPSTEDRGREAGNNGGGDN